jgi:hypothetical protein
LNAFQRTILAAGLNDSQQNDNGWLYALLSFGAFDYEGADTFTNPVQEVYRRLEAAGIGPHTLAKVKSMLNSVDVGYQTGANMV